MGKTEIIETNTGRLQGYVDEGIHIFKGIPFAEPPIGDLRFKPPVKRRPWEGILDATEYGPFSIQNHGGIIDFFHRIFGQEILESEDCLTLNIWTPAIDRKKRPVMIWLHGGSFIGGGSATVAYDGKPLTTRGDIVVVSINYRLGAFGFLYIPGITANAGLLDQIAALEWIQKNIGIFGGDPDNVTIFGQSAGACSGITLIGMPTAKGLFNKVIAQSSPIFLPNPTTKSTNALMEKLGLKARDIETLRELKTEDIIEAQREIIKENVGLDYEIMKFRPSIDKVGGTLPIHPLEALKKGEGKNIDILIGCNEEEQKTIMMSPSLKNVNAERAESLIAGSLRPLNLAHESKVLIQKYKNARKDLLPIDPVDILIAIGSDLIFRIPDINIAEAQSKHNSNVFFYIFTWPSPLVKGACHIVEIPFVFGTVGIPGMKYIVGKGSEVNILSEKIMDCWIAFARSGNPNHGKIPKWPVYDTENRATMMIGKEFKVVNAPYEKEREIWDDLPEI